MVDSDESFKQVWDVKKYDAMACVIALSDNEVLTYKTPDAFAGWFSNKLAGGCLRSC